MLLALALALVLSAMGIGIVLTHEQSKNQILKNFRGKGSTSAGFVSTYLSQQAAREAQVAQQQLDNTTTGFPGIVASFGAKAGVLLDSSGRLLQIAPADPAILGSRIAPRYPHLSAAEAGRAAVSGVVPSAAESKPVVAIAVPYATSHGRRVFSVAYPVAGSVLAAFVDHTVAYKRHIVLLVDAAGKIITGSPPISGVTLHRANPALARATSHASRGRAWIAGTPSTFEATAVAGTPWHLLIVVPDAELFASINGWALWLPWIVLAVIAVLSLAVLVLFSRSLVAHGRLERLSGELAEAAHTDLLTGLGNRRSLQERLPQAWAYANRHKEPLSALMIDLDHFKQINDAYGHDTGDELLRAVGDCMRTVFRASDIYGRWGGDEFIAFLPGTDVEGANLAGKRLRDQVEALDLSHYGPSEQVTLSFGSASAVGVSIQDMITAADKALYRAKRAGHRDLVAGA